MRKCWPYGFNTTWYGSQWRQWEQYDKFKIGRFIKFGKESPSRRDKILRRYQTIRKRESHQARKDFNQKREREREVNTRIFVKLWENIDSSKDTRDMRFHERSFKLRRMSKNENSSREENPIKLRKIRKRKNKTHFIKKVCTVKSRKMKVH